MKQAFETKQMKAMLKYFLLALAIIAAYKLVNDISYFIAFFDKVLGILSPFMFGFLIAYVLNLPCGGIRRLLQKTGNRFLVKNSKTISIAATYALLVFIVFLVLRFIIPSIQKSIVMFIENFQYYYESASNWINYINGLNFLEFEVSMEKIINVVRDFGIKKLPESINAIFGISMALFDGFLAIISSIYILIEKENFKKYLCRLVNAFLPLTASEFLTRYARTLNVYFKRYIFTQTIDSTILGTIVTIELYLFGSPYALLLGVMLGIANYIPYFGAIFGCITAVIVVAFTQGLTTALITAIALLITQQIDGNIIQPRLVSGSFLLSPLLVIISITVGGAFYGAMGMLVAIPIVAVIKNMFEELLVYAEAKKDET